MSLTLFLAQIWGPIILAIGLGVFVSRNYYIRIYRDLEKEPLAILVFGILGMVLGIIQVSAHNTWSTLPEILVSLLGWMLLIKAAVFLIIPRLVDWSGDFTASTKLIVPSGGVMLVIGLYLTWFGYLA